MSVEIAPTARPRLPKGVKLKRDEVRGQWTLLAPERIFRIDQTAATVIELCDGVRDFAAIVSELATKFNADRTKVEGDVAAMLKGLADKRVLEL